MLKIKSLKCLKWTMVVLFIITTVISPMVSTAGLKFGIISVVKDKIKELKEKRSEYLMSSVSTEQTDSSGEVKFTDKFTKEEFTVRVGDYDTGAPIANIYVSFFDGLDYEVFTAVDSQENYFPSMIVAAHHSNHIIEMKKGKNYTFSVTELTGDDGKLLAKWEQDWAIPTKLTYYGTISKEEAEQLHTVDDFFFIIMKAFSPEGYRVVNSIMSKASDLVQALEYVGLPSWDIPRFDVYRLNRIPDIFGFYRLVWSNIPTVTVHEPQVSGQNVTLSWEGKDKTTYPPWENDIFEDITVYLGPTNGSDLTYSYKIINSDNLSVYRDWTNTTTKQVAITSMPSANYKVYVKVTDEVDNVSTMLTGTPEEKSFYVSPNNPPNTPNTPSGPSTGSTGTSYTFSTSATDPDGDQVQYRFDWGDGNISGYTSLVNSGSSASKSHSYSSANTYYIKAQAKDSNGAISGWSGTHSIIITGGAGAVSLSEAVDNASLSWSTGGDANWFGQTSIYYYGGDSAESGDITDNQQTYIQTTVTGPGTLKFYWKVSSESGYDYLRFYIDGAEQDKISGSVGWQQKTYSISSGNHTAKWSYTKDISVSTGSDCGWLDKVEWTGGGGEWSVAATYNSPGSNPGGLEWDGSKLWSCDYLTEKIYKHNMDTALSVAATYNSPGGCPEGLAWDGSKLWSCDRFLGKIYKHNMDATLSVSATYNNPGDVPTGLAWDGSKLWSCDYYTGKIYKHNMDATLSVSATYNSPGIEPEGLAWDGSNLWSCDSGTGKIYKHNMDATLSVSATYNSPGSWPSGLAWDGSKLWSCDYGTDKIYKHNVP